MDRPGLSRRCLCRTIGASAIGAGVGLHAPALFAATGAKTNLGADDALALLKKGNDEYLTDSPIRQVQGRERRIEIARSQTPFAVLVSCSDSRVPPELLFGRGLGELFIIRNAGNTVDTTAMGSIEYAVAVLGVPLVVVMGHERCGAVAAAIDVVEKNAHFPGSITQMVEPIIPAVLRARAANAGADADTLLNAAIRENVRRVVDRIKSSEAIVRDMVRAGKVKIVGARYDLDDGQVDFFEST